MIKESTSTRSSQEEDYVRLDEDMERNMPVDPLNEPREDAEEDDEEPPLISSVFAVDQLKQGAATAAAFFFWGLDAMKEKATALKDSESVQKMLETTKPQREAVSASASNLWEGTRPQREELSKTASSLGEKLQPQLEKIKVESTRALETLTSTVSDLVTGSETPASGSQQEAAPSASADNV